MAPGGVPWYENVFLTMRNGIFFGLPLMCFGELTWKSEKRSVFMLTISALLLLIEISFVGTKANPGDDRSMYLLLPLFIYYLVLVFRDWNPQIETRYFGWISSAIYVMQFGIITVANRIIGNTQFGGNIVQLIVWILVICIPTVVYLLLKNKEIVRWIF